LIYRGHADKVFAVAWSPDGQCIASGSRDGAIQLWNPRDVSNPIVYHSTHCILTLAWSPNGLLLAAGDTAGVVRIWSNGMNWTAGAEEQRLALAQPSPLLTYHNHKRFVRSVSWSPDGRYLVSGGDFGDSTVQVWEASSGRRIALYTEQYRIFAASWSPQDEIIASASFDGTVQLWKALSGEKVFTYCGHHGPVYAVVWSPDGQYLASAGQDATVQVWSVDGGSVLQTYRGHAQAIKALAWSSDGRAIASGSDDATVQIWSPLGGQCVAMLDKHPAWIRAVAWSPDSTMIAVASDNSVYLWEAAHDE
jgi:WD40 repeat protein